MIEDNYLRAVISLPSGVFQPYSGVKTSILLFDKELAKKSDNILFVKVNQDGYDLGAQRRPTPDKNDLPKVLEELLKYKELLHNDSSHPEPVEGYNSILVPKSDIIDNGDYNLSMERYRTSELVNSDWPMVELGEICEIKRGTSITRNDVKEGNIPVIAGGKEPSCYHNVSNREGETITVSGSGANAGYLNFFTNPIFASDCFTIKPKEQNKVLPKFVYAILKNKQEEIYKLQSGGGQPHVYPRDLEPFKIPLPPLEVQEQIVAELDGYQKIIDGAKQIIENYKPTIKIDPEWEMVELGEVCEVISGQSPESKFYNDKGDGLPFFQGKTEFTEKYIGNPKSWTTQTTKESIKGDILMSVRAPVGPVNINKFDKICIGRGLCAIRPSHKVLLELVFNYLVGIQEKIKGNGGAVFDSISRKDIEGIKIPLPPLEVQQQIVAEIEKEQAMVESAKGLIEVFEGKVKEKIGEVWGE